MQQIKDGGQAVPSFVFYLHIWHSVAPSSFSLNVHAAQVQSFGTEEEPSVLLTLRVESSFEPLTPRPFNPSRGLWLWENLRRAASAAADAADCRLPPPPLPAPSRWPLPAGLPAVLLRLAGDGPTKFTKNNKKVQIRC